MEETRTQDTQPKYIRARGISEKYAIALSTVWYWTSIKKLPQPTAKLGNKCTVWNADEIENAFKEIIKANESTEVSEVSNG